MTANGKDNFHIICIVTGIELSTTTIQKEVWITLHFPDMPQKFGQTAIAIV